MHMRMALTRLRESFLNLQRERYAYQNVSSVNIKYLEKYIEDRREDIKDIKANGFKLGKVNVLLDWMNDRDTLFKLTSIDPVVKDHCLNCMANLIIELALIEEKKDA